MFVLVAAISNSQLGRCEEWCSALNQVGREEPSEVVKSLGSLM